MAAVPTRREINEFGPGRHRVSDNLYLVIGDNRRSWVFIYVSPVTGKRREMGLGPTKLISFARAKELTLRCRLAVAEGHDPVADRHAARPARQHLLTFRQVAEFYIAAHVPSWRNPKHRAQWTSTLETYAFPVLGDVAVKGIDTGMVMRVLEPIWHSKPATASRLRGRIEVVLDYAAARHWRQGDNPARWRGHVENLLPHHTKVRVVEHRAALPWHELPVLWSELAECGDLSALALRFVMATATRTNETLGAMWSEIDLDHKVWVIPATRVKANRQFRVPLSTIAVAVLSQAAALRQGELVFPGARAGRPLSTNAMQLCLRRLRGTGVTVHGMRSAFRDWAAEHGVSGEVGEMALGHAIATQTERAYRRGDLLEPRRVTMERWARFLTEPAAASEVIALRA